MQDVLIEFPYLTTNVRIYGKCFDVTNTLAYFVMSQKAKKKKFCKVFPGFVQFVVKLSISTLFSRRYLFLTTP
jgi:hypothetical protein